LAFAALAAAALLYGTTPASAKPAHLKTLVEYYGPFLPAALNNCGTCHLPATGGKAPLSLADFPHNAFGKRIAAVGEELRTAGKRSDIVARIKAAAAEDSDGDGVANETEILAGRRPGDPKDRPTAAELALVARNRPRFLAFINSYRWRP